MNGKLKVVTVTNYIKIKPYRSFRQLAYEDRPHFAELQLKKPFEIRLANAIRWKSEFPTLLPDRNTICLIC